MNQKQFAQLLGVYSTRVSHYKARGWMVYHADGSVDVEASMQRIAANKIGGLRPATRREASQASHWGRGPHCNTQSARKAWATIEGRRNA
jgi:hypothetical protein